MQRYEANRGLVSGWLKRATVWAAVGVEILVFHHAKPPTMFAASAEILDLHLQTSDAVAFGFFLFGHEVKPPFLPSCSGDAYPA